MSAVAAVSIRSFNTNDLSSLSSSLPVIRLSSVPELPNAISIRDSCYNDIPVFAVATLVSTHDRDADSDHLTLRSPPRDVLARAEYVSAHFYKASQNTPLGIKLGREDNTAVIVEIAANSQVAKSPLKVGDKIVSINQLPCSNMTNDEIYDSLESLKDITLIVHNSSGGTSNFVESMLTKKHPKESIGIKYVRGHTSHKFLVSHISATRAISNSLLNVGDEIVSINGVAMEKFSNSTEAKELIAAAPNTVTIKAVAQRDTGVVLGEIDTGIAPQYQLVGATRKVKTTRRHGLFNCLITAFVDPSRW